MPPRKALSTLSANVKSGPQIPPAKVTQVARRKVRSTPQKTVKPKEKDVEYNTGVVEYTLSSDTFKP